MRRTNLNRDPVTTLAGLIEGARSAAEGAHTRPTGSIFLQDYANISWFDSEAHERSIRELDSEMSQLDVDLALNAEAVAAAKERLDAAEVALDEGLAQIDAAEKSLTALTGDLSDLDSRLSTDVAKAIQDAAAAKAAGDAAHTLATKATKDAASANDAAAKAWARASEVSMLPDGDFPAATSEHWHTMGGSDIQTNWYADPWGTGIPALQVVSTQVVSTQWVVPVTGGRTLRVSGEYANGRVRLGAAFRTAGGWGAFSAVTGYVTGGTSTSWGSVSADVVVPPGAVEMRVAFQHDGSENTYWRSCRMIDVTEAVAAEAKAEAAAKAAQAAQGTAADAKKTAETALASAAGGVMRYTGLTPPTFTTDPDSGKPVTRGSTYWQWDGSATRDAIGQWVYDGSTWLREGIRSEVITNLDLNKLTVGGSARIAQLVADKIIGDIAHYGLLTAERILIGSGGNLIPDGAFEKGGTRWHSALSLDGTDRPPGESMCARSAPGSGGAGPLIDAYFDVEPGVEYVAEMWLKADKAGSRFFQEIRDDKGAHAGKSVMLSGGTPGQSQRSYLISGIEVPVSWTRFRVVWTPNSGVTKARLASIYFNHSSGSVRDATVSVGPIRMKRRMDGELLVDGSIGARHIMADEVAGAVGKFLKLDVGQLTATGTSTLNDVVAQHIAARSGQFLSLDVGQLTATETANLNEVVAQRIASATGAFQQVYTENIVSRGGTFDTAVIRDLVAQMISSELFVAGSRTGQRIEITGNGLRAYDAYGTETASLGGPRNAFWVGEKRAGTGRKGIGLSQIGASDSYGLVLTSPGGTRSAPAVFSDRDGELTLTSGTASGVEQFLMWMNSVGIFAGTAGQAVTNSPSFRITSAGVQVPGKWFSRSEVSGDWGPLAGGSYTLTGTQANLPIAGRRYSLEVTEFAGGAKTFFAIDDIDGRAWTTAKRHNGTYAGWKAAN